MGRVVDRNEVLPRRGSNPVTIAASSFYNRFTENLQQLLSELLEHALDEVAVPHPVSPEFDRFRDVIPIFRTPPQ